jgi:5'-nucleotidase (lipoprotein e(P4) family)
MRHLGLGLVLALVAGCASTPAPKPGQVAPTHPLRTGVLWQYGSAEYAVLASSSYAQATTRVLTLAHEWRGGLARAQAWPEAGLCAAEQKPAVILDIDETVLLNAGYEGYVIATGRASFVPEIWAQWEADPLAPVRPVPGVQAFLKAVIAAGVEPIFLSNRSVAATAGTRAQLAAGLNWASLGYDPKRLVDGDTLLLQPPGNGDPNKVARRDLAASRYCILALFGDQTTDFTAAIDAKDAAGAAPSAEERVRRATAHADLWGNRWFLLPNVAYGKWVSGLEARDVQSVTGTWAPPPVPPQR